MTELIPNNIYKRAAAICDDFPIIDFLTIASIIYADTLHEANKPDPFAPIYPSEPVKVTESEPTTATLDNKDMNGTGLHWTNATAPTDKKIHRRLKSKTIVVDGAPMEFKNANELCKTFNIDIDTYRSIVNGINYKEHRGREVLIEAKRMKAAVEAKGHNVTSYYAYTFDNKWIKIDF